MGVLTNFANFTGKHLCWSLFKIKLQHGCFPVKICEIFKSTYFYRTPPVVASEYLGPNQTSMIEMFCKNSKWLIASYFFCKKAPSRSLARS